MVDKSDGLNNLTNTTIKRAEKATQTTDSRDDYKNCMDLQYGFAWDLDVNPLTVEVQECMDKYVGQLLQMDFGDFPVVELENDFRGYVPIFPPQSGVTADTNIEEAPADVTYGTMKFRDQYSGYKNDIEVHMDPTRMLQDKHDADLGDFFSRPQKIFELEWGTGTNLNNAFNPWRLFFNNKRVNNRIANFKLMRCNLRMKVVVNGNGFQYGRLMVVYQPLNGFDQFGSHAALVPGDLVQTSQLPKIFVDPTTSSGGEMLIPFFYHQNYFDITRSDWGPENGQPNAGQILIRTLNPLKHANGATDKVTLSFFVWAEDMQLSIPTSAEPGFFVPQSGSEIAEANTKGMISGPATTVAKMAGIAAGYAPVAPYALATAKVATTVASMAKLMGYSRPPLTKNPDPLRPTPISQLATTTTPDTALKMTVDDQQELTIDPRISGVGSSDPLVIRDIAKRESYLTKFSWEVGAAPETLLWNARVDPCLWNEETPDNSIRLPAVAAAALPFKFWTGSLKFRFQVVCSTFHKGRLEIRYDPSFVVGGTAEEYNINYIEIVDIAETQDFTIEVGPSQPLTLMEHFYPQEDAVTEGYSVTDYVGFTPNKSNGVISVRILNELTIPRDDIDNDIEVNVFVSAGEDFEVFLPTDKFQSYTFAAQSGVEIVPESQNTTEPSAPQQALSDHMAGDTIHSTDLNKVFVGESIVSFRPLIKRYNLWRREMVAFNEAEDQVSVYRRRAAFPFYRGNVPGAVDLALADAPYNFCNTVLLHWLSACFSGSRGSIRYKYLFNKSTGCSSGSATACCDDPGSRVYVEREDHQIGVGAAMYNNTVTVIGTGGPNLPARRIIKGSGLNIPTGAKGTVFATDLINPNVEFEVPFQKAIRFMPGKRLNYTSDSTSLVSMYNMVYDGHTTPQQHVDIHVAAGEDYQFYFWTGMPRIYYEPVPPNPQLS